MSSVVFCANVHVECRTVAFTPLPKVCGQDCGTKTAKKAPIMQE